MANGLSATALLCIGGMMYLAYGPVGGIDPTVAVFWVVTWAIVLGRSLYASLVFFKPWPDLDEPSEKH